MAACLFWTLAVLSSILAPLGIRAVNPGLQYDAARVQACQSASLPPFYQQYLNTAFIGPRQQLQVGTVNYSYFRFGPLQAGISAGRPLVLIAGLDDTIANWPADLLSALSQTRPVILFDNRGFGDSSDSFQGNYTISAFADSTVDLLEALGLDRPDVLGWALGGFVAMALAVEHPAAVNHIIVADSVLGGAAFAATPAGQEEDASLVPIDPAFASGTPTPIANYFTNDPVGNAALCRYLALTAVMPQEAITATQTQKQGFLELDWHGAGGGFVYSGLPNVTNPFLVIGGNQDLQDPIDTQRAIFALVPSAQMLEYADAAHMALFQHSLSSAAYINVFLSDVEAAVDSS